MLPDIKIAADCCDRALYDFSQNQENLGGYLLSPNVMEKNLSWISNLYDTYESCKDEIGKTQTNDKTPLLPIAHSTQNTQLEVTIDRNSNFLKAEVVDKKDVVTIIPCTEDSVSRGNGNYPHPLFDKLQYVAGDYTDFCGAKGDKFYEKYVEMLEDWCNSLHGKEKVTVILIYLKKKKLIADLVESKVLYCDKNCKLLKKWNCNKNCTPKIFKELNSTQS